MATEDERTITIQCDTPDARIYYTVDGSIPDQSSTLYTAPFTVDSTEVHKVNAVAYKSMHTWSDTASALVGQITLPLPQFSLKSKLNDMANAIVLENYSEFMDKIEEADAASIYVKFYYTSALGDVFTKDIPLTDFVLTDGEYISQTFVVDDTQWTVQSPEISAYASSHPASTLADKYAEAAPTLQTLTRKLPMVTIQKDYLFWNIQDVQTKSHAVRLSDASGTIIQSIVSRGATLSDIKLDMTGYRRDYTDIIASLVNCTFNSSQKYAVMPSQDASKEIMYTPNHWNLKLKVVNPDAGLFEDPNYIESDTNRCDLQPVYTEDYPAYKWYIPDIFLNMNATSSANPRIKRVLYANNTFVAYSQDGFLNITGMYKSSDGWNWEEFNLDYLGLDSIIALNATIDTFSGIGLDGSNIVGFYGTDLSSLTLISDTSVITSINNTLSKGEDVCLCKGSSPKLYIFGNNKSSTYSVVIVDINNNSTSVVTSSLLNLRPTNIPIAVYDNPSNINGSAVWFGTNSADSRMHVVDSSYHNANPFGDNSSIISGYLLAYSGTYIIAIAPNGGGVAYGKYSGYPYNSACLEYIFGVSQWMLVPNIAVCCEDNAVIAFDRNGGMYESTISLNSMSISQLILPTYFPASSYPCDWTGNAVYGKGMILVCGSGTVCVAKYAEA